MYKIIGSLYVLALVFAPIAFGTTEPWSQAFLECLVFSALLFFFIHSAFYSQKIRRVPGLIPCCLFLAWMLFQVVPLPLSVVELLSPATLEIYKPLLLLEPERNSLILSIHPWRTIYEFFRFSAFVAMYFLTVQLVTDQKRLEKLLWLAQIVCLVLCVQAVLQYLTHSDKILWFKELVQNQMIFGVFAYANDFSGYVAMLLPITLVSVYYYKPKMHVKTDFRFLVSDLFGRRASVYYLYLGLIFCVLFLALLASASRAGMMCSFISLVFLFLLGRKHIHLKISPAIITFLLLFALVGLGASGLRGLDNQFATVTEGDEVTVHSPVTFWKSAVEVVKDFPVTGTGAGTFASIYPSYIEGKGPHVNYVHNDYLETLTDGGVISGVVALIFFGSFFYTTAKRIKRRRNRFSKHIYLGSLAGIVALLLYCSTEFHFRFSSAVGLYFFFLLGVHVASTYSLTASASNTPSLSLTRTSIQRFPPLFLAGGLFFFSCAFHFGIISVPQKLLAERASGVSLTQGELETLYEMAAEATRKDKMKAIYHTVKASTADKLGLKEEAQVRYIQAIRLNPARAMTLLAFADFLSREGRYDMAEDFYKFAIVRDRTSFGHHASYANWLLKQGRLDESIVYFKKAMSLSPEFSKELLPWLSEGKMSLQKIYEMLPDRVVPHLSYAELLQKNNEKVFASEACTSALKYLQYEKIIHPYFFMQPYRYYQELGENEKAMGTLLQALEFLPDNFRIRLTLGDLFENQGMLRKAAEQYKYAQHIRPEDKGVALRIQKLSGNAL